MRLFIKARYRFSFNAASLHINRTLSSAAFNENLHCAAAILLRGISPVSKPLNLQCSIGSM